MIIDDTILEAVKTAHPFCPNPVFPGAVDLDGETVEDDLEAHNQEQLEAADGMVDEDVDLEARR